VAELESVLDGLNPAQREAALALRGPYAHGEGVRASRTLPFDPDAELARLREQLVAETTRRAVQALKAPDPLD
jgi:hypothetical protein